MQLDTLCVFYAFVFMYFKGIFCCMTSVTSDRHRARFTKPATRRIKVLRNTIDTLYLQITHVIQLQICFLKLRTHVLWPLFLF